MAFLELSGVVGVRRGVVPGPPAGSDFSLKGSVLNPPMLSSVFARVDNLGFATKSGYALMIYLPDAAAVAGFVHETFASAVAGFDGGTNVVGIDHSEALWCAYAQPIHYGGTGMRRFFSGNKGDLLQSANHSRAGGVLAAVQPDSAFLASNMTSPNAVGTRGRDGDQWRLVN